MFLIPLLEADACNTLPLLLALGGALGLALLLIPLAFSSCVANAWAQQAHMQ